MTIYTYLLNKKESGEIRIMFQAGLPAQLLFYLDIYAYHLAHPKESQFQVALYFGVSKKTVWRVYRTLSQSVM